MLNLLPRQHFSKAVPEKDPGLLRLLLPHFGCIQYDYMSYFGMVLPGNAGSRPMQEDHAAAPQKVATCLGSIPVLLTSLRLHEE